MKAFIVFSALMALAAARPGLLYGNNHLVGPVAYARLVPGAPIGVDGRVVDTPEVAVAKAEHAAAHINERITLANEAVNSADHLVAYTSPVVASGAHLVQSYVQPLAVAKIVPGAPIGLDGRVVDTPEVSYAKAEHAAAHINEKITLAQEAVRSGEHVLVSGPLGVQKYVI